MLFTPYFTDSLFCQTLPSKNCCQGMFFSLVKLRSFSWSLSIEQVSCRDAVHAILHRQLVLPNLPVKELLPGHVLLFGKAQKLLLVFVHRAGKLPGCCSRHTSPTACFAKPSRQRTAARACSSLW